MTIPFEVPPTEPLSEGLSAWLHHVRWVSAFVVLIGHVRNFCFVPFSMIEQPTWFDRGFYAVTNLQNEAVLCFFVISGYLVGGKLVHYAVQGNVPVGRYVLDRMTRLYCVLLPAFGLMLFTDAIGACDLKEFNGWFGNFLFGQDLFVETTSCNTPLWSLTNEFWYYLLGFLATILWLRRDWIVSTLAMGIVLVLALADQVDNHHVIFYFPMWAVGILLLWSGRLSRWVPPVAVSGTLFLIVVLISRSHLLDPLYVLVDFLIAATLCLFLASIQIRRSSPLMLQAGRWLATFSYSLYLVHWPILKLINHQFSGIHNHNPHELASFVVFAGMAGICVVCAYLFALLTERHTSRVRGILSRAIRLD